ncbi:NAD(P)/FAD-dependent oxidoreductase [Cohaesibacter intestini]|uniref:NAD(P)/FAD-dependent oxidoreductase n=1 Tax=Cohaesibacter intestini TaxID=2211145 RepID=UPI000DEBE7E6|nr:FAD-binding oxidoreductase [Cohaesibacter intestini]
MTESVLVCGAGMVGTSIALELQRRGMKVTLLDRREPGLETSHGNAGIITRTSLVPINNPMLWQQLPKLMLNQSASMRYKLGFMLKNTGWAIRFLLHARPSAFERTAKALFDLIELSRSEHARLIKEAEAQHLVQDDGWLFLYRSMKDFNNAAFLRQTYQRFGLDMQMLEKGDIAAMEPGLKPIFEQGVWIRDTRSIRDPSALVQAYAKLFVTRGGTLAKANLVAIEQSADRWHVKASDGEHFSADKLVIALGPWSKDFLARFGFQVPMGYERGYHMHYSGSGRGEGTDEVTELSRPIYDVSAGYVLAPMRGGLRLCTGVELADIDAEKNFAQLELAEASARQAVTLGERQLDEPWMGCRPTMPDCRPVIGAAPGQKDLYFAFGHQHIGVNTGPGTARILADQIEGREHKLQSEPFRPERFIRPRKQ